MIAGRHVAREHHAGLPAGGGVEGPAIHRCIAQGKRVAAAPFQHSRTGLHPLIPLFATRPTPARACTSQSVPATAAGGTPIALG